MRMDIPICDIEMTNRELKELGLKNQTLNYSSNREEINRMISELVEGSCDAILINGEPVYNSYIQKPHKERILENLIRWEIIRSPHQAVMCNFCRARELSNLIIIMFGDKPFRIDFTMDRQGNVTISGLMSERYKQRFNNK